MFKKLTSHDFFHSALSVATDPSRSEPHRPYGVGDSTRACVQAPPDHGVEELHQHVEEEWDHLDQEVIDNQSINQ